MKKSVLMSFLVIGAVAAMITAATTASFSDTVESADNTFETGTLLLSVNDQCGLAPDDSARTTGSDTACQLTDTVEVSDLWPGKAAESKVFNITNDGSIDGTLAIDVVPDFPATCAAANWNISADPANEDLNSGDSTSYTLTVQLDEDAGNDCQDVSLSVDVTFSLTQNT